MKANEKGFRRKRFLEGTGNPIVNRKERIKLYTKELGKSVNRTTGKTNLKKKNQVKNLRVMSVAVFCLLEPCYIFFSFPQFTAFSVFSFSFVLTTCNLLASSGIVPLLGMKRLKKKIMKKITFYRRNSKQFKNSFTNSIITCT